MCATLRATCGRPNRQSCRFVIAKLRRWCRHRAPTSPASTASLLRASCPSPSGPPFGCSNSLQANLCAKREVARAADAFRARQTSSCGPGVDWGQQRPPQPRRKAPLDDPGSSPGQALGTAPQARFQHRREHVRPLRRRGADRGQDRRTHRHPRHPRPLRKARRAGASALPIRPACTARCGRVTPAGHDADGETRQDHTKRQRTRRAVLGPLSGIGEKLPQTARRRAHTLPKSRSRTSDPRPNRPVWRLRDRRLLARRFEKGV